ncbi:MAG: hypothetical protein AAF633_14065, partial [Chloroflexota bacterium]
KDLKAEQPALPSQLEEPIRFPPADVIGSLVHNTRRGAVAAIREDIDRLAAESDAYTPFHQQVSRYLSQYQLEKLHQWLEAGETV